MLMLIAPPAVAADTFVACWVSTEEHPVFGTERQVTRCRIAGGEVVDYASDSEVPSVLFPQTGNGANGECWYYTSTPTAIVILALHSDGRAEIGLDTDPNDPNSLIAIGPTLPRCTSEPVTDTDHAQTAWEYVTEYIHPPPTPELSPRAGDGITGLDTYLGLPIPGVHTARISSGSSTIDVFIEVSEIIVNWGDGKVESYPADPEIFAGYPDGSVIHVYEAKIPDGPDVTVEYGWTARWRLVGGDWERLDVPNTTTTTPYPLSEIVSVLTD